MPPPPRSALLTAVFAVKSNGAIGASVVFCVFLWGANNAGLKYLVGHWPLVWTSASRMLLVGVLMLALLRWTTLFGPAMPLSPELKRAFWWRGGVSLAVYIVTFTLALKFTSASHVALYLATAPVWALLWEGLPEKSWDSARRYGAALLALAGVFVLFAPKLKTGLNHGLGDALALLASVLWTNFSRQCRVLGEGISGAMITAHTMWRGSVILMPMALYELASRPLELSPGLLLVQTYCVIFGGVIAFAYWNNALKHWPTSKVFLLGNLIPLFTMGWSYFCLHEPVTATFWPAMGLIVAGVILGQANWQKILGSRWLPGE